ncbi:MAG: hypothetical protein HZB44_05940 [Actinobacteria bacterium]|nr:hypothetical protein [Actinomycetota bacterium]
MRSSFAILVGLAVWCAITAVSAGSMLGSYPVVPTELDLTTGMGWVDSDYGTRLNPIDRALLARAKSHLKQAELAQEIFLTEAGCYATDLESLQTVDPGLPDSINVAEASCSGYTIESPANDSADTVCSLKKVWGKSEYHALPAI